MLALVALSAIPAAAFAQAQMTHFVTLDRADMLSSNVVGLDVYDGSNTDIGTIKDVAFDSAKAVKGYVLSVGGFLGMGTHYVAVDADSVKVKYDATDKKWHANMAATKDQLKAAPEFKYEGEWNASRS
jgi:sporulation protein YlmC with PRC-barrel domain